LDSERANRLVEGRAGVNSRGHPVKLPSFVNEQNTHDQPHSCMSQCLRRLRDGMNSS
jgi:hypothetical protein